MNRGSRSPTVYPHGMAMLQRRRAATPKVAPPRLAHAIVRKRTWSLTPSSQRRHELCTAHGPRTSAPFPAQPHRDPTHSAFALVSSIFLEISLTLFIPGTVGVLKPRRLSV